MQLQSPQGAPPWHSGSGQRLGVSTLVAAIVVAVILSVIRLPDVPHWLPVVEMMVRIVDHPAPQREVPEVVPPAEMAESPPALQEQDGSAGSVPQADTRDAPERGVDVDAMGREIVREYLDLQLEDYGYFNPDTAEKRRRLAGRYQPGVHEKPKPIWENVERDTLGRTVLRSGDCFKVLDDPNVGSREAFEVFGQFMAKCTYQKRLPKELPWVNDVREQYDYLRDADGYLKGEDQE